MIRHNRKKWAWMLWAYQMQDKTSSYFHIFYLSYICKKVRKYELICTCWLIFWSSKWKLYEVYERYEVSSNKIWLSTFNSALHCFLTVSFNGCQLCSQGSKAFWSKPSFMKRNTPPPPRKGQKRQRQLIINPRRDAIFIFIKMLKASWLRQPKCPCSPF